MIERKVKEDDAKVQEHSRCHHQKKRIMCRMPVTKKALRDMDRWRVEIMQLANTIKASIKLRKKGKENKFIILKQRYAKITSS